MLSPARQKRPQLAAKAQRDNREPNNDRGDADGGNADSFPHFSRLPLAVAAFGLYLGILWYRFRRSCLLGEARNLFNARRTGLVVCEMRRPAPPFGAADSYALLPPQGRAGRTAS